MPPSAPRTTPLAAAAARGDVAALSRAVARGAASITPTGAPKTAQQRNLEAENSSLRRELDEVRQAMLPLLTADAPPADAATKALPAAFWLEAQLKQSRRHVQLLSEALVNKAELSTELEAILLQIRQQPSATAAAEGGQSVRGLTPEWAASAMRRIRSVQFAEGLADVLAKPSPPPSRRPAAAGGRGASGGRGVAMRGSAPQHTHASTAPGGS